MVAETTRPPCESYEPKAVLVRDFAVTTSVPAAFEELKKTLTGDGWNTTADDQVQVSNLRRRATLEKAFGDWTGEAHILILDPPQRFTTRAGTDTSYQLELSLYAPTGKSC